MYDPTNDGTMFTLQLGKCWSGCRHQWGAKKEENALSSLCNRWGNADGGVTMIGGGTSIEHHQPNNVEKRAKRGERVRRPAA